VKLNVSTAFDSPYPPYLTGQSIKGIGVFFSPTDPFINNDGILSLSDTDPNVIYDENYFHNPQYYSQTGGTNGTNWMTVERMYSPTETKNYITIGNFQYD
jgi:hypothetical protein